MHTLRELQETCDLVLRLASMQSINQAYSNECEDDDNNEYEGPVDAYDQNKVSLLRAKTDKKNALYSVNNITYNI